MSLVPCASYHKRKKKKNASEKSKNKCVVVRGGLDGRSMFWRKLNRGDKKKDENMEIDGTECPHSPHREQLGGDHIG